MRPARPATSGAAAGDQANELSTVQVAWRGREVAVSNGKSAVPKSAFQAQHGREEEHAGLLHACARMQPSCIMADQGSLDCNANERRQH